MLKNIISVYNQCINLRYYIFFSFILNFEIHSAVFLLIPSTKATYFSP